MNRTRTLLSEVVELFDAGAVGGPRRGVLVGHGSGLPPCR